MASPVDRPPVGDGERGNAVVDFVLVAVLIMALLLAVLQLVVRMLAAGDDLHRPATAAPITSGTGSVA